jgi:hypothetical protein
LVRFIQVGGADDENVPDRWKRHRNEPSCVVGEHRHCCPLGNDVVASPLVPQSLLGDVETVSLIWVLFWVWEAMNEWFKEVKLKASNKLQNFLKTNCYKLRLYKHKKTRLHYIWICMYYYIILINKRINVCMEI